MVCDITFTLFSARTPRRGDRSPVQTPRLVAPELPAIRKTADDPIRYAQRNENRNQSGVPDIAMVAMRLLFLPLFYEPYRASMSSAKVHIAFLADPWGHESY